jgi:formate-dependent nitrite reductase membrane component NrfD
MELAVKIVGAVLGFITAVVSYGFYDDYILAILALIGAIATGVVVYGLVCAIAGVSAWRR